MSSVGHLLVSMSGVGITPFVGPIVGLRSNYKVKCQKSYFDITACCHIPCFEVKVNGQDQRPLSKKSLILKNGRS